MNDCYYDNLFFQELNPIELLGYAKNNIVEAKDYIIEAKDKADNLPKEYMEKLNTALLLIDNVQEYLFDN